MTKFDIDYGRAALDALSKAEADLFLNELALLLGGKGLNLLQVLSTMSEDLQENLDETLNLDEDAGAVFFILYCKQILKKPELKSSDSLVHS